MSNRILNYLTKEILGTIDIMQVGFPFLRDKGTLNVGAPADIAILELREGNFSFIDNYENVRSGTQRLFPFETLLVGKRVPRA